MAHSKRELVQVLETVDLGSSVAELDNLLDAARVETSVFSDLLSDRVDLVPGTKGSGKSALYRIFVDFLSPSLLKLRRVVVAHGVRAQGDSVFQAFKDQFGELDEDDFVNFWCVYLVSLAHEQFLKNPTYSSYLGSTSADIEAFRRSCQKARIPEITAAKTLRDVLAWALNAIPKPRPKISYYIAQGKFELDMFGDEAPDLKPKQDQPEEPPLPRYIHQVKDDLETILSKASLHLWLMVDKLDEIFPRRSKLETRALRGLLRTLRIFQSEHIRVKIFVRDDILDQVTSGREGFTALTHITARQADTLRWSQDEILTLVVNRLFASDRLCAYLKVDREQLKASRDYREKVFYRVFCPAVYPGSRQSPSLRWIHNHTMDGRGVVTPRDVIDLLTKAKQLQQNEYQSDLTGQSEWIIGPNAIRSGLTELSERKRDTLLRAELPHLWSHIEKFIGGKAEYSERTLKNLLGQDGLKIAADLIGIGFLSETNRRGERTFKVPFVYRDGLDITQGAAD